MSRFTAGTVAVVTGGGGGLGAEICHYLARQGALVVVADIDVMAAHQVVGDIGDSGGRAVAVEVDVARRDDMEGLVAGVVRDHGRLDLLVNNAAIGLDGEFQDMTLEDWERVFATDVWSVVVGTHFAYQVMLDQGGGQIVNVSSLAGLLPGGLMTSYVASKHAVVGLTLGLRAEARQYGIRVNALCPGFVETALHDRTRKVSAYLEADAVQRDRSRFPTAADVIGPLMRGVERDRAIVVAPRSHALFWYLYRLAPSSIPFMWSMIIRRIKRRARH
jgi:NAD(P)-dependent dehydrogenase (short-subunit alcohol dehydrogenase family)